ncbi:hypothetical protein RhiJN_25582 [Ceratobasidium sp. AG-Ba]|nr:hypothetical protein RhiJN_25582 [Ceratobasidium sp. AG-Ba]
MGRARSPCWSESVSSSPSTLELPEPILPCFDQRSSERPFRDTLIKLSGPFRTSYRSGDLSEALDFLRSIRRYRASFSSLSSSKSNSPLPDPSRHVIPTLTYDSATAARVAEWRQKLEPVSHPQALPTTNGPWRSFLPSCAASSEASSSSFQQDSYASYTFDVRLRDEASYRYGLEEVRWNNEKTCSQMDEDDEDEMWPYDGRGLYEHHPKGTCGDACYIPCRLRRKFRPRLTQLARKLVSWLRDEKQNGERAMKNSDIPHPPWTLEYRSNDDSLDEDHDDGDLEIWLEHLTEKEKISHELRLELRFDGKPDSRIFSF